MARRTHLYRFSLDDRSTDYADLERGNASTAPAPWQASQRSNFEQPSRVGEIVQARRRRKQLKLNLAVAGLLLLCALIGAAALAR
ncbi:MAG TPA: hypothetical protein VFU71_11210 [Burkholderiaceae bacterium]|nr:hypothetical protein [Burkholderiaceae bacterium]